MSAATIYALVTLLLFAPALPHLKTHLIGDGGDCFEFYWNAWWIGESLFHGHNPYWCDRQFAPSGVSLVLHTLSLIPSIYIALLGKVMTLPAAYNVMVMALFPVAGLCMFALARYITRGFFGALAGGMAFMLCPFMASKSLGHLNLLCAGLLPLFTLCLLKAIEPYPHPDPPPNVEGAKIDKRVRKWWLAAIFTLILFCNEHTAIFAGNVALWIFLYLAISKKQWRLWFGRFFTALWPTLVICTAWGGFVGYFMIRYGLDAEQYRAVHLWPEPVSYVLPLHSNSIWHTWFGQWESLSTLELAVYLGWLVFPIAVIGCWVGRGNRCVRMMLVIFVIALALSAGDKLRWHGKMAHLGNMPMRLPMNVYRHIPVLGAIGESGRYLVIGYMAMAVGVAAAIATLNKRRQFWTSMLVMGLVCLDYGFRPMLVPLPTCLIPPGDGLVLDPRLGNARALYDQTLHGRRLMGGYVARIPKKIRSQYEQMPDLGWFFQFPQRRGEAPTPEQVTAALAREHIEYVCVSPGSPDENLLVTCGLERIFSDGKEVVLRVPIPAMRPVPANLAHPASGPW